MAKEGSTVSGLMDTLATMTSIALQYGVPLRDLVSKFAHVRFEPSGFTGNPEVPIAKSIVDYIFRWMGSRFLAKDDRDALGIIGGEIVSEAPDEPAAPLGPEARTAAALDSTSAAHPPAPSPARTRGSSAACASPASPPPSAPPPTTPPAAGPAGSASASALTFFSPFPPPPPFLSASLQAVRAPRMQHGSPVTALLKLFSLTV